MKRRKMNPALAVRGAFHDQLGTPTGLPTPFQEYTNRMSHASGATGQQARMLRAKKPRGY